MLTSGNWRVVLSAAAVLCVAGFASAGDWPQFLGPNSNGVSSEKGLLKAWPAGGPKVLWTISVGAGYGGAAVRDGKVYVFDRKQGQQDILRCLDLGSGKEEWTFAYDAPGNISHEGSRCTPAVTEKYVYIIGPFGHMHCIDRATHQVVWKKNLLADYGGKKPNWAVSQSPLLYKNLVIVAPASNSAGMVAFEQESGKEVWKSAALGPMDYASPMPITIDNVEQIVFLNGKGAFGVSAADGKSLWDYAHPCKIPVPNVTSLGGGKLFVTGGYRAGSAVIQVAKDGEKWAAKELAKIADVGGHCHPALFYQDHLYMLCNTNERQDGMVCFDSAGKIVWQTKKDPYLCKGGSILTGDGLMYVMDGEKGDLYIVEPSPAGFKSLGKAKLLAGKEIWGPLSLADGKLLIRDQTQMKCVELKP
jgi:outer membrane protein assembly factor BamB